jgi:hypothetical protein
LAQARVWIRFDDDYGGRRDWQRRRVTVSELRKNKNL